jgi:cephalosporin-C deacetylase-like acetyl esterase
VTQRGLGRRGLLDAFARELSAYKQVAYMWRQLLGNSLRVLSTNQALFDQVAAAVKDYNRVSDDFIPRLSLHRDRLTAAWSEHRGLGDDVRGLVEQVEEQVYRGAMLRLNRLHEIVHSLVAGGAADAATMAAYGVEQQAILDETAHALDDMSKRSTHLISALEREI